MFSRSKIVKTRPLPSREEMLNRVLLLQPEHRDRVEDYLASHRLLVDTYPERLFLATNFFPNLAGVTLNVGVMEMNAGDHLLLQDPHMMRSLDTDKNCAQWGSPYGHWTCDFLEWQHESELGGITLFGVLGDRNDRLPEAAHIGLESVERVALHAASLLAEKGQLLLGIELSHTNLRTRRRNVSQWGRWLSQSPTLQDCFGNVRAYEGHNNVIVVASRSWARVEGPAKEIEGC